MLIKCLLFSVVLFGWRKSESAVGCCLESITVQSRGLRVDNPTKTKTFNLLKIK